MRGQESNLRTRGSKPRISTSRNYPASPEVRAQTSEVRSQRSEGSTVACLFLRFFLALDSGLSTRRSCGGRNRTCVGAINSRLPVPARDPPQSSQSAWSDSNRRSRAPEARGFPGFPTRCDWSMVDGRLLMAKKTAVGVFRCPSTFNNQQSTFSQSAQRESNPHFRHGKAAGCRYIMGASLFLRLLISTLRLKSTGWDSNPRRRITNAESSPLNDQCPMFPGPRVQIREPASASVLLSGSQLSTINSQPSQWDRRGSNPHHPG